MTNPTTPEAPVVSEEQRARAMEWAHALQDEMWRVPEKLRTDEHWREHIASGIAQALAQESSREHERAEGLAMQLKAEREHGETVRRERDFMFQCDLPQAREEAASEKLRAEGLAKELDAARAAVEAENLGAKAEQRRLVAEKQAATARVAELSKELVEERSLWRFVPDLNGGHMLSKTGDWWYPKSFCDAATARVAELEKQLADVSEDKAALKKAFEESRVEMNLVPHRIEFREGEELAGMQIVRVPSWLMRRIAGSEDRLVLLAPEAAQQMRTLLGAVASPLAAPEKP